MATRVKHYLSSAFGTDGDRTLANLVHRDVVCEDERQIQTRLIALLLIAGTILASVFPFTLIPSFGARDIAAPVLALSATALALAGMLIQTGRRRAIEIVTLVLGAAAVTAAAIATGGFVSAVLPLVLLFPAEAYRIRQDCKALRAGFAAAAAVLAAIAVAQVFVPQSGAFRSGGADIASVAVVVALGIYGLLFSLGLRRRQTAEREPEEPAVVTRGELLSTLPGLVTLHDARGDVVSVSGADATEMLEHVGDVAGRGLIEHMHVSDRIRFLQAVDDLRTGCKVKSIAVRLRKLAENSKQDQFLHLSVQLVAQHGQGGFRGFLAQASDISEYVSLRRAYARKVEEADAANEAKTRFLAAVSHELRTPLNAILGFSDFLSGEYLGDSLSNEQREYVGLISESGQHLLSVINSMLDLTKIEAGRYELNLETFNVKEAVDTCEAMLAQQAQEKGVVLNARVAKGRRKVTACRRALQQILINLMANAIKFTDEGGVVTVDASEKDGWVELVVSDTGIGIAQDDLHRIGAPFVQVENRYDRQYEGTGLGLSLVKGLVALHGGQFVIDSTVDVGTTVTVRLPVAGPDRPEGVAQDNAVEFPPRLTGSDNNAMETVHEQAKTA
ncbi:sensor histidine kinase [Hoeflea poritis]|uniref:histidine kinase n=1 Tax=Hoeflea poritis TaxID=2993659 RepID=A0ABT4VTV5_9HYPH|nr:HAMP domain-containing sensor histidine kinase [Hoeflea poritis]MDA4848142.1 HAMP domain-containing sensor histidine kinase [Hoeflea poritis]